jgi:hypothetical protein
VLVTKTLFILHTGKIPSLYPVYLPLSRPAVLATFDSTQGPDSYSSHSTITVMDPSLMQSYFDRLDKRAVRKIIATAIKSQELPVTIRPVTPQFNPNKHTGKRKASR